MANLLLWEMLWLLSGLDNYVVILCSADNNVHNYNHTSIFVKKENSENLWESPRILF